MVISIHALCEEGDFTPKENYQWQDDFYPRPLRGGRLVSGPVKIAAHSDFYPRPLRGGRRQRLDFSTCKALFLSTPSARRATEFSRIYSNYSANFYPRPLRGGRHRFGHKFSLLRKHFYPRPLRGGRLQFSRYLFRSPLFLSTPSARRATWRPGGPRGPVRISIHALCEEGDFCVLVCHGAAIPISIHALCEEGDPRILHIGGGGHRISIHALCEEGDDMVPVIGHPANSFLSTPSARRATWLSPASGPDPCDFYPRPLRGGRPYDQGAKVSHNGFLSTPSARRATYVL